MMNANKYLNNNIKLRIVCIMKIKRGGRNLKEKLNNSSICSETAGDPEN